MGYIRKAAAVIAAVIVAGCSSSASTPSESAHDAAVRIQAAVSTVTKVQDLTDKTDANHLLGRSNGYSAAAVIYDSRAKCYSPGVDCGVVVEQWGDNDAAKDRSDYIQGLLKGTPMLGSEYDYVSGDLVLRVTGKLTKDQASEYQHALETHESS